MESDIEARPSERNAGMPLFVFRITFPSQWFEVILKDLGVNTLETGGHELREKVVSNLYESTK